MTGYRANGKQVLCDGEHFADAITEQAASDIAAAMNGSEPDVYGEYDDLEPEHTVPAGSHHVRQENDEYACSCGMRWDASEGEDHP